MDHDPIRDEHEIYTMNEFREILNDALREFVEDAAGTKMSLKKMTFNEWMSRLNQWMSW